MLYDAVSSVRLDLLRDTVFSSFEWLALRSSNCVFSIVSRSISEDFDFISVLCVVVSLTRLDS